VKGDSFSKSYPKKQDITYLQALKDIKAQIEFLNKCAFDKSILTSDEHFALLGIEEELNQLIHYDPIRKDNENQLRYETYSIINGTQLPDNLE
jgi:viroplasmin and RNaseH domain-containing protein